MAKPSYRKLIGEMASLLGIFTASFLVGEFVTSRTGSVWWGALTGSFAFIGVIYTIIRLVSRVSPPSSDPVQLSTLHTVPTENGDSPRAGEMAGFLTIFLAGQVAGHLVAARTGHMWLGILAGALTVTGIVVALMQISRRLQAMQPTSALSPQPSCDQEIAWAEPREFRRTDLEDCKKWVFKMIGLTVAVAVIFLTAAYWFGMEEEVARKLLVNAGGIVVMFLGLLGFTRLMRIVVKITGKAIIMELGETPAVYRFEAVDHCELGTMLVGSRTYSVLVVALKCGDREILCVDSSVSPHILRSTLEQRGVKVVERGDTMSEQALESENGDPYSKLAKIQRNGKSK